MKRLFILAALFSATATFAQQAPVDNTLPAEKWNCSILNAYQTAFRFTNDALLAVSFENPDEQRVVLRIKGNSGVTLFKRSYRSKEKMTQFDVAAFPTGRYRVEVSVNDTLLGSYSFEKEATANLDNLAR